VSARVHIHSAAKFHSSRGRWKHPAWRRTHRTTAPKAGPPASGAHHDEAAFTLACVCDSVRDPVVARKSPGCFPVKARTWPAAVPWRWRRPGAERVGASEDPAGWRRRLSCKTIPGSPLNRSNPIRWARLVPDLPIGRTDGARNDGFLRYLSCFGYREPGRRRELRLSGDPGGDLCKGAHLPTEKHRPANPQIPSPLIHQIRA
jgi:hypothetical protein